MKEASLADIKVVDYNSCPILNELFPNMCQESSLGDMVFHDCYKSDVFASLEEVWSRKGQKVASSRWLSFIDALAALLPQWSRKLCTMLYDCLELGLMNGCKTNTMLLDRLRDGVSTGTGHEPGPAATARDTDDVRRLRNACRNTLHVCTLLLSDRTLYHLCAAMVTILGPCRKAFGNQLSQSRSADSSRD